MSTHLSVLLPVFCCITLLIISTFLKHTIITSFSSSPSILLLELIIYYIYLYYLY